jgi:predicted ATP-dependent serine protease
MAKDKTLYTCQECGGTSPKWLGKCPHCNAWNTLEETRVEPVGAGKNRMQAMARLSRRWPTSKQPTWRARPPASTSWTACWAAASWPVAWC